MSRKERGFYKKKKNKESKILKQLHNFFDFFFDRQKENRALT